MRILSPLLIAACFFALSACGSDDAAPDRDFEKVGNVGEADQIAQEEAAADGKIDCAVNGAKEFGRVCKVDRIANDKGQLLTIYHPNGGFRRYRVLINGKGVEAAEGAEQPEISVINNDWIEVSTAGDRYRLPARVKGSAAVKPAAISPAQTQSNAE